jgi:hypothetical protein
MRCGVVTTFSPMSLLLVACTTVLMPMASIPDITLLGKYSSPIGVVSLTMLVCIIVYKYATSEEAPVRLPPIEPPLATWLGRSRTLIRVDSCELAGVLESCKLSGREASSTCDVLIQYRACRANRIVEVCRHSTLPVYSHANTTTPTNAGVDHWALRGNRQRDMRP